VTVQRRRCTVSTVTLLLLPMLVMFSLPTNLDPAPNAEAATNCTVSSDDATPAWGVTVEKQELTGGGWWGQEQQEEQRWEDEQGGDSEPNLNALTDSFHTSFQLMNDSAVGLRMNLTTGWKYTFCIDIQPENADLNQETPIADVYLLQEMDFNMYETDFGSRHNDLGGLREDIAHSPPWLQNMLLWHPFRDVHAYEKIDEVEFAVALDHEETTWDPWSEEANPRTMHLMIESWNNIRDYDEGMSNRNFSVDVTVMVEERFALPNWTVAVVCCGGLLGILAAPFLVHRRYMKAGSPELATADLMPHLETGAEQPAGQVAPPEFLEPPPPAP
jgi:hypothetical protein